MDNFIRDKEYLEFKFTNDFKDMVTLRIDDATNNKEEAGQVARELADLKIFQGKNAVLDKALSARLVVVEYEEIEV